MPAKEEIWNVSLFNPNLSIFDIVGVGNFVLSISFGLYFQVDKRPSVFWCFQETLVEEGPEEAYVMF